MRRFGVLIASLALCTLSGCFYSFAGGGLPPHIHTMAIVTFDNQTPAPEIPKELYDQMRKELQRRLGVRDAPQERADALVHGVIASYDADVPVSFSANPQQAVTARDESIAVTNRKRRQLAPPLHAYPVSQPLAEIAARFPGTSPPLR